LGGDSLGRPIGEVGGILWPAADWGRFLSVLQRGVEQEQLLLARGRLGVFRQSFFLFFNVFFEPLRGKLFSKQ